MSFKVFFTKEADNNLETLEQSPDKKKRLKAVQKALGYLEVNPRHPSLNTHKYETLSKEFRIEVFEAYAENKTPQAYRIFWHYGPGEKVITVIAITPHP
ncbi:MAG: hypothetical protein IBJ00_05590 [Alphaproteobacteria bacterium]|nr:hypothetical protein [Alphaproteobacteria bacterium]